MSSWVSSCSYVSEQLSFPKVAINIVQIRPPFWTTPGKEPFWTQRFAENHSPLSVKTMQLTFVSNPHAKANSYSSPSSVGNTPSTKQSTQDFNHQKKWLSQYPALTPAIMSNKHVIHSFSLRQATHSPCCEGESSLPLAFHHKRCRVWPGILKRTGQGCPWKRRAVKIDWSLEAVWKIWKSVGITIPIIYIYVYIIIYIYICIIWKNKQCSRMFQTTNQ